MVVYAACRPAVPGDGPHSSVDRGDVLTQPPCQLDDHQTVDIFSKLAVVISLRSEL